MSESENNKGSSPRRFTIIVKKRTDGFAAYRFTIIVEKRTDGFIAYPLGLKGVVLGEGDTFDHALSDVKSAIRFHYETFGTDGLEEEV